MRARTRHNVVTGHTTVIPLIGHPVEQVKSPGPMNRWFDDNGVDAVVVPMDIRPEKVKLFFELLRATENAAGCSVTMPHKQAAFLACDEVTDRARRAKAVNTVRRLPSGRLVGDMTDGLAFVSALTDKGIAVEGRNILLVGAGGAGTAIALKLAAQKAAQIAVIDIDQMRQRALVAELRSFRPEVAVHDHVPAEMRIDIAINASPAGMQEDDQLPYPVEKLKDAAIVADAVTKPVMTRWLEAAKRRGLQIQTGEEMAVAQLPIQLGYLRLRVPGKAGETGGRPGAAQTDAASSTVSS